MKPLITFKQYKQKRKMEDSPTVSIGGGAMSQEPVVTKAVQTQVQRRNKKNDPV